MTERILIAGAGGQGVMLLGKIIARAAIKQGLNVTWLPSYGAEVRGGTAHCLVTLSDSSIGSPCVDKADTMIIMNEPSLERFKYRIKKNGLLIVNESLVKSEIACSVRAIMHPFTDISLKLGNIKVANMVALGCYLSYKRIIDVDNVFKAIEEIAPVDRKDLIRVNKDAVSAGAGLAK